MHTFWWTEFGYKSDHMLSKGSLMLSVIEHEICVLAWFPAGLNICLTPLYIVQRLILACFLSDTSAMICKLRIYINITSWCLIGIMLCFN